MNEPRRVGSYVASRSACDGSVSGGWLTEVSTALEHLFDRRDDTHHDAARHDTDKRTSSVFTRPWIKPFELLAATTDSTHSASAGTPCTRIDPPTMNMAAVPTIDNVFIR